MIMSIRMTIKNLIKGKIEALKQERNYMLKDIKLWPNTTLGYARRDLAIKFWELKISIWESVIN